MRIKAVRVHGTILVETMKLAAEGRGGPGESLLPSPQASFPEGPKDNFAAVADTSINRQQEHSVTGSCAGLSASEGSMAGCVVSFGPFALFINPTLEDGNGTRYILFHPRRDPVCPQQGLKARVPQHHDFVSLGGSLSTGVTNRFRQLG